MLLWLKTVTNKIQSIRGTHDILPGSVELWQRVERTAHELFSLYGYAEIRTPIFEDAELFTRSIGAETDIVRKEMYTLTDTKGKQFSLRPEGTASVVRSYIEHSLYHDKAAKKLYYIGPMFRRERPQKGRYRQFHQIGAEVLGSDHPAVEAEVVEMLERFFSSLELGGLRLLINSVGCVKCRPTYLKRLREDLVKKQAELCSECQHRSQSNALRVFDCKVDSCQLVIDQLPNIIDHICKDCRQHFEKFEHYLDFLSHSETIICRREPRLVRGLDYYVRTAFEIVSDGLGPTQNALVGGGRYDGLSEMVGGPPAKGFGFALGMERLILLLSGQEDMRSRYKAPPPDLFLAYIEELYLEKSLKLAQELRRKGIFAYVDFETRSLKAQTRLAHRLEARYLCVVGEDEIEKGKFVIKRMKDGEQTLLSREDIATHVIL